MAVLVTGGAGYIGSHMVLALTDAGEDTVVVDNLSSGYSWCVSPKATLVCGDIGDDGLMLKVMKDHAVSAVIHFAGSIIVPESVADPLAYYHNNTVKSRTLMECAVKSEVPHFIFSSTAAVYGNPARLPIEEDQALHPISPYGTSKLMTELMLRDSHAAYGLGYAVLRYFNVAGADPLGRSGQSSPRATHLIKVASQVALGKRTSLDIFGSDYDTPDGTCLRDYIHVSDLVSAHMQALSYLRDGGAPATFNCGYGRGHSVLEVIGAVERAQGTPLPVRKASRRAGDPAALVANADKARKVLGWKPVHDDLDEIVASALAWERHLLKRNAA
jgi:UDP-glucose 4-epimerase